MGANPTDVGADEDASFGRFSVVRRLGSGGMGVVYEARDRASGARVALKTVRLNDPASVHRFKNEFRALADIAHPNLVALYDLFFDAHAPYFTMELVPGVDFLRHVALKSQPISTDSDAYADTAITSRPISGVVEHKETEPVAVAGTCDFPRLRESLRQLAHGLVALHTAGKLHRDIKPSNVLAAPDGRVVLLDFGLVRDIALHDRDTQTNVAGTPEFMSPEQAAAMPLTPASDWYSVGVMLYQALTGRLPFSGPSIKVMMDKQLHDPAPVQSLAPSVPDDLSSLCMALLRRSAAERPDGADVLARLGGQPSLPPTLSGGSNAQPFIGRERHLAALSSCVAAVERGETMTAYVHGTSGMGKSLLVQRFLESIAADPHTVVLRGRCFERESVPYKAVDSLVDSLADYLRNLPEHEVAPLLPRDVASAARLFSVLLRVGAIAEARKPRVEAADDQELRRRGFAALREIFARVGARRRLILFIDDLQWGDIDSAALLGELLRPPDPPVLLLIASYRSEDAEGSAPIAALRDTKTQLGDRVAVVDIDVGPLTDEDARVLALSALGRDDEAARRRALAIAAEAGGSPFFVDALARSVQSLGPTEGEGPTIRLADFIATRLSRLPEEAHRLLEIIALAGQPIAREIAVRAASVPADRERTAISVLRAGQLIRTVASHRGELIETYHDRIRELVAARISAESAAASHRRLAFLLDATNRADPESLVMHFRAAGELERAAAHAALAASRAAAALAFNRAAEWYRTALELGVEPGERGAIQRKLGDALANAGRGADAAEAYFAAAEGARGVQALELKRMGASELLRSGHIDRGLAAVREVLLAVGIKLPQTPRRALISMLLRSLYLSARGLRYRPEDPDRIAPQDLNRVDICWSLMTGFGVVDNVRAREMQTRHLSLALKSGEAFRVARALASEMWPSSIAGPPARARVARIEQLAADAAERSPSPHAKPFLQLCRGVSSYLMGDWRRAIELLDPAAADMSENLKNVAWEVSNAHIFSLWSHWFSGSVKELMVRVPRLVKEARDRGDLLLETTARIGRLNVVWLAADAPDRALHELTDAMSRWSHRYVHQQHYYAGLAEARIHLYTGRPELGLALVDKLWPRIASAFLLKIQSLRAEFTHLRAQLALAVAQSSESPEVLLASAERDARRLAKERTPWIDGLGHLVTATIAHARGDDTRAVAVLTNAEGAFRAADMPLFAFAAQYRRGELLGGDEGAAIVRASSEAFVAQQVTRPEHMLEIFAPGFGARRTTKRLSARS